jgi:hypothetical protein
VTVPIGLIITWLRLWSVLYHVTVCQHVLYHVTAPIGLCFITWPCLSPCALSRDCACRSVFITWRYQSVSAVSQTSMPINCVCSPNCSHCSSFQTPRCFLIALFLSSLTSRATKSTQLFCHTLS